MSIPYYTFEIEETDKGCTLVIGDVVHFRFPIETDQMQDLADQLWRASADLDQPFMRPRVIKTAMREDVTDPTEERLRILEEKIAELEMPMLDDRLSTLEKRFDDAADGAPDIMKVLAEKLEQVQKVLALWGVK